MSDTIVGIDLGTTNSEIAAFIDGQVRVLGPAENKMLPSCIGFSMLGELLVGQAARNQLALFPERTVRSIKRRMGSTDPVQLGEHAFSPQEISALILRELVRWAEGPLGEKPRRAVITVPAYFSDAQRAATREAGALAGLEVVRILNEPTAASLAYGYGDGTRHTVLVYDLGGGTFDVSVVLVEGEVTEVLASHGNNKLGGDDFDDLLASLLMTRFYDEHGIDLRRGNPAAKARVWWAAEEAKKRLSFEPYVKIREEALATEDGIPRHLETEVSRDEYESLIRSLVDSTFDSVSKALQDAGKRPSDLDAVLLVGGSTRTPLVSELLKKHTGLDPRTDVHPDLCVALGAGVLASRLSGHSVERVLVDVSPYSFGVSYLGERGGFEYPHCYHAIIKRNTPLPVTRTDKYLTSHPHQTEVDVQVYQGEDEDALKNILVGDFRIEGLASMEDENEVLCRMRLDIDGVLEVTAVEKRTGKSKGVSIQNALRAKTPEEIEAGRKRLKLLFEGPDSFDDDDFDDDVVEAPAAEAQDDDGMPLPPAKPTLDRDTDSLLERSRRLLEAMHPDDREEAIELHERIQAAAEAGDQHELDVASNALRELLFFIEGKG
jgi:molecular chaperone DnaK (HSP70)